MQVQGIEMPPRSSAALSSRAGKKPGAYKPRSRIRRRVR